MTRRLLRPLLRAAFAISLAACNQGGDAPGDGSVSDGGGSFGDGGAGGFDGATDGGFVTATHPAEPEVPYGMGPLLVPLHLVTIIPANDAQQAALAAFADKLPSTKWWTAIHDTFQLGAFDNHDIVGPPLTAATVKDADLLAYIKGVIAQHPEVKETGTSFYFVFLPDGVDHVQVDGSGAGCQVEVGFHTFYGTKGDAWGEAQRCPNAANLSDLTNTFTHEIAEAATDPDVSTGYLIYADHPDQPWLESAWTSSGGGEIADLCDNSKWVEGGDTYARVWSNAAAKAGGDPCVPATSDVYVAASAAMEWYPVKAGQTVTVPLTGWSTAPTNDWAFDAAPDYESTPNLFRIAVDSLTHGTFFGSDYPSLNNGRVGSLTVTVPAGTASGAWSHVLVSSYPPSGDDYSHDWPVGFYVP